MNKFLYPLLFTVIFICSYLYSSLQAQEIISVEITPEYPSNTEEIFLIVETSIPFLECRLDSVHPFYACGAFSFDAFYGSSFDIGSCERTDTLSLGILTNGLYVISYRMYFLGWSQVDQVDTSLTVGTTRISEVSSYHDQILKIWPNPSNERVNFSTDKYSVDQIRISNTSGSYDKILNIDPAGADRLNTLSLPSGLYICTALSNGRIISTEKFIVLKD